jgi:uncharacterized protein (TIGR02594 family)
MPNRLDDYQDQYEQLFRDCRIVDAGKQQEVDDASAAIQAHQARYAALAAQVDVPWYFVAVVHQREASGNFSQSVRDGHRLPAGLSWEDDALAVMQEQCGGWHNWSLPGLLYRLEAYNGFGYRQYQINSPYLWSFATCYTKGKYVGDGEFDPDQVDKQPGTAVILHRLVAQGLITIPGAAVSPAAPTPQQPAAPATSPSGRTYVVQPGDTLSAIAASFGLTWQDIWEANQAKVPDPDVVYPGQELLSPGAATSGVPGETPPEPSPPTTAYTVKAGDTLPQIAQDHGLSLARLLELNPNLIQAGMQLLVPAPATAGPGPEPAGDAVPRWLLIARQEVGVHENSAPGQDNPRILEYLESTTYDGELTDEVPWCSAFVNWCITQAGLKGTNSAAASSWLTWGQKLDQPRLGCIVVFNHHVGFYAGAAGDYLLLLGGNQSNAVKPENKHPSEVLAYRWPANA